MLSCHRTPSIPLLRLVYDQKGPDHRHYVIATGETHSVREFCELAFAEVGLDYKDYVKIDGRYSRPAEVDLLICDAQKARADLGWDRNTPFMN